MKVSIWLKETSQPIEVVANTTYTKGPYYVVKSGNTFIKYPIQNIWRVIEVQDEEVKSVLL